MDPEQFLLYNKFHHMIDSKVETITAKTIADNAEADTLQGKVEKKSGKRIGYNYIILKSLKESRKNDVVKCFYIKGLTNFGYCVIKEGTYGECKDASGRDIKDRLVWQQHLHKTLQNLVKIPKFIGSFEENGNYYLVIEHIKGKPLFRFFTIDGNLLRDHINNGKKIGTKILDYLLQVVSTLEMLHQQKVVHRDVTSSNFIVTPGGKVFLIDMELSYSLDQNYPSPPFQLGTMGFMSPAQENTALPTIKDDIYSIGAIILHAFTDISPNKLGRVPIDDLRRRINFFISDQKIADLILRCLDPNPEERPYHEEIRSMLQQYKSDIKRKVVRTKTLKNLYSKQEITEKIQQVINSIGSPLMSDPERGWFSEKLNVPSADKSTIQKGWYASFNRGAAGIIYLLARAKELGFDISQTESSISIGMDLIYNKYVLNNTNSQPGLHYGSDGVAVALASAWEAGIATCREEDLKNLDLLLKRKCQLTGIVYGIAGQGIANMLCSKYLDPMQLQERLDDYVTTLLNTQTAEGCWNQSIQPNINRYTKGFANGTAGILHFLLSYAADYNAPKVQEAALKGVNWLMRKAIRKDGKLQWLSSKGKELTLWWYDGITGITLLFLKAYQNTGNPEYRKMAVEALKSYHPQIYSNGLSQTDGISGLGEVYLEAFKVLKDEEWLDRASHIAQLIMHLSKTNSENSAYWLTEREREPIANFMVGNSGILHLLLRFTNPGQLSSPLLI